MDIPQQIRTNTTYLSAISKQIENYGDDIVFQFERVLPHIDPADYNNFFTALDNPKSIDHVRFLAGDFESIPGINNSSPSLNGMPKEILETSHSWQGYDLDLNFRGTRNFTEGNVPPMRPEIDEVIQNGVGEYQGVQLVRIKPGTKIYRVFDDIDAFNNGGYWTFELPSSKANFYGNTAVRPE